MNNTSQVLDGNQLQLYSNGLPVETAAIVVCLLIATWTISANTIIVVCFLMNRKKIWPIFSTQILSLSLCDMCVGYASLPVVVFPFIGVEARMKSCGILMYVFFAAQCASINHILCLCVQRCNVIRNLSKAGSSKSSIAIPLLSVLSAWIASFSLCIFPTTYLEIKYPERKGCTIEDLFGEKASIVLSLVLAIYLVPQVFTNILYLLACFRLKILLTQVFPSNQNSLELRSCEEPPVPTKLTANRSRVQIQKKVLGTIGLLMLIFNVCTIPQTVLLKVMNKDRNFRYILSAVFLLNSALNPLVYAYRTKWIRLALQKMCVDCLSLF